MPELCVLCRRPAEKTRSLVSHHYRGRKEYPGLTMRVHDGSCHNFGDFITRLYIERGIVDILEANHIIYLFTRVASVRENGTFILPVY